MLIKQNYFMCTHTTAGTRSKSMMNLTYDTYFLGYGTIEKNKNDLSETYPVIKKKGQKTMKKHIINILTLILAVALTAGMLAACGSKTEPETPETTLSVTETTQEEETKTAEDKENTTGTAETESTTEATDETNETDDDANAEYDDAEWLADSYDDGWYSDDNYNNDNYDNSYDDSWYTDNSYTDYNSNSGSYSDNSGDTGSYDTETDVNATTSGPGSSSRWAYSTGTAVDYYGHTYSIDYDAEGNRLAPVDHPVLIERDDWKPSSGEPCTHGGLLDLERDLAGLSTRILCTACNLTFYRDADGYFRYEDTGELGLNLDLYVDGDGIDLESPESIEHSLKMYQNSDWRLRDITDEEIEEYMKEYRRIYALHNS